MIRYFQKDTSFDLKSKLVIKKWIKSVIGQSGKRCRDINVIFCSDPSILEINIQFLGHDYYTDIITFDYCEGKDISGELYISIDTVQANAVEYGEDFDRELHRVIIHGILHLLGWDDHSEEDIKEMRKAEDSALNLLDQMLAGKGQE
ncbi:MAG: rRNA maturation RNase YbeY [Bacteroidales bacterium]|nr:rRNA maturation RNase YbeY [Bacteroidales bacterium]